MWRNRVLRKDRDKKRRAQIKFKILLMLRKALMDIRVLMGNNLLQEKQDYQRDIECQKERNLKRELREASKTRK